MASAVSSPLVIGDFAWVHLGYGTALWVDRQSRGFASSPESSTSLASLRIEDGTSKNPHLKVRLGSGYLAWTLLFSLDFLTYWRPLVRARYILHGWNAGNGLFT